MSARCPGGAEYGHGMSLTTVHAGGCCERWAQEQAAISREPAWLHSQDSEPLGASDWDFESDDDE
jgi:hypothetical protein